MSPHPGEDAAPLVVQGEKGHAEKGQSQRAPAPGGLRSMPPLSPQCSPVLQHHPSELPGWITGLQHSEVRSRSPSQRGLGGETLQAPCRGKGRGSHERKDEIPYRGGRSSLISPHQPQQSPRSCSTALGLGTAPAPQEVKEGVLLTACGRAICTG